jgi:hypothetical protein
LFDWWQSRKPLTEKSADKRRVGGFFGPHVILEELRSRIPRYLDEVDRRKRIYPACKRALSDLDGVTLAHSWWLTEGARERSSQLLANGEQPPLMFYLIWSDYTRLTKHIAAATVFGSSINRAAKLVALPADHISRYEAAQDPLELHADTAQS